MYKLEFTGKFKKDYKICRKSSYDISLIETAFNILAETGTLPFKEYKTHKLAGTKKEIWDAHIEPDWLLLWTLKDSDDLEFEGVVSLIRTGAHSNLFGKKSIFK